MSDLKGYISKEEWVEKGNDPEKWLSPEDWKKRGEEILPIVRDKLSKTEQELANMKGDMQKVLEFNKKQEERIRKEEREKILREFEAKKKQAVEDSDYEALNKAEKERDEDLKKTEPEDKKEDPVFDSWRDKNSWYSEDQEMQVWADTAGAALAQYHMSQGKTYSEALDLVAQEVNVRFKDKFENPARKKAATVETEAGGKTKGGNGKMDKISDIADANEQESARKSFNRIKTALELKGRKYTEKDYMSDYTA